MEFEPRRFEDLEEVQRATRWVPCVEITPTDVARFIGDYSFKQAASCGLSDCQTPHKNGFVALSRSGVAFLVGHICGRRRWGLIFGEHAKQYRERQRYLATTEQIERAVQQESQLKAHLRELYERNPYGLKWINRARLELARALPPKVYERLLNMSRRGEVQVTRQRLASEDERELKRLTGSRATENEPIYIDEKVGALDGLLVIREDIDAPRVRILSGFERYHSVRATTLTARERTEARRWAQNLALDVSLLEEIVAAAPRFFNPANFELFVELAIESPDQLFLKSRYWDFSRGSAIKQFSTWRSAA